MENPGYFQTQPAEPSAEEVYLYEQIDALRRSYENAIKPYINRLVVIQQMKAPAPMFVSVEQAQALGLVGEKPWGER